MLVNLQVGVEEAAKDEAAGLNNAATIVVIPEHHISTDTVLKK